MPSIAILSDAVLAIIVTSLPSPFSAERGERS
jgi:hypothetical protein